MRPGRVNSDDKFTFHGVLYTLQAFGVVTLVAAALGIGGIWGVPMRYLDVDNDLSDKMRLEIMSKMPFLAERMLDLSTTDQPVEAPKPPNYTPEWVVRRAARPALGRVRRGRSIRLGCLLFSVQLRRKPKWRQTSANARRIQLHRRPTLSTASMLESMGRQLFLQRQNRIYSVPHTLLNRHVLDPQLSRRLRRIILEAGGRGSRNVGSRTIEHFVGRLWTHDTRPAEGSRPWLPRSMRAANDDVRTTRLIRGSWIVASRRFFVPLMAGMSRVTDMPSGSSAQATRRARCNHIQGPPGRRLRRMRYQGRQHRRSGLCVAETTRSILAPFALYGRCL
uniref:Uncharacterized protein n=1 Tax=Mycena chlorophos TaxID=658473 RepID=A0ABQ0LW95_MYCCL|nr:predicted protein [Mycena chlorophos]